MSFTQQGVEKIKYGPARLERAKAAVKAAGGEMKAFYPTMGRFDAVAISERPSDEAYAMTMLALAAAGAVRTETLRAFTEEELGLSGSDQRSADCEDSGKRGAFVTVGATPVRSSDPR